MTTLSIVGAGKVGRVLGYLFSKHQVFDILDVCNRSLRSSNAACKFIKTGNPIKSFEELRPADIFMLTVPDKDITSCSQRLQALGLIRENTIVFHCSGALSSEALCLDRGAASLHPIRSFADPAQVAAQFVTTICSLEGDEIALKCLSTALIKIGARTIYISKENKTIYHAAAVFASNYLVTLMDAALSAFEAAGMDRATAKRVAEPLAKGAFTDIFRIGSKKALTGPIARGDMQTVERHKAALHAWDSNFEHLYAQLADSTIKMRDRENDN